MEHPENSNEYKGLTVNAGVQQPSIVNPYLKRGRFKLISSSKTPEPQKREPEYRVSTVTTEPSATNLSGSSAVTSRSPKFEILLTIYGESSSPKFLCPSQA